jgi:hypothetical protein
MNRIEARLLVAIAAALLIGQGSLFAAIIPATPGPGPWSGTHPLWFDDGDGVPEAGELTGAPYLTSTDCTQVVGIPTMPGTGNTSPCVAQVPGAILGGSISRPDGMVQSLVVMNSAGTQFHFEQEPMAVPGKSGVSALALSTSSGDGTLLDIAPFDGIYDTLQIQGTHAGTAIPTAQMSLLPRDVNGDGRPDYITLPWATGGAGLLGVRIATTPQIYVPLTDTNADGWPDTVTVQVGGGGVTTATGPAVSGPALAAGLPVPSLGAVGLFLFAASLVAIGAGLLRGTAVAS